MSQLQGAASAPERILDIERRISEHEANLKRMVVQGCPTQAAEDLLRKLKATLLAMKCGSPVR